MINIRHWQVGDYLGGLFLGLFPVSLYMFLIGHMWYGIYLAVLALTCLVGVAIWIIIAAIAYGSDEDDSIAFVSEYDRKLWRK